MKLYIHIAVGMGISVILGWLGTLIVNLLALYGFGIKLHTTGIWATWLISFLVLTCVAVDIAMADHNCKKRYR